MKFEHFFEGQTFTTRPIRVTKEGILQFGKENDPQYLHIDEEAAKEGPFEGLIASGFHTLSLVWVDWIKQDVLGRDCLGGIGMDHMKWRNPVRPGDVVEGTFTILKKRPLGADRGVMTFGIHVMNQKEEEVLSCEPTVIVARES